MTYADAETQTVWAGLTKMDLRPDILFTAPDTTTPPAEMMITEKHQGIDKAVGAAQLGGTVDDPHSSSFRSLIERRKNRPDFPTRISLPKFDLDDEVFPSPPPTHAALSPLPEANKRFAGHTPLVPRARSPVPDEEKPGVPEEPPAVDEEEQTGTPMEDQPLIGPLMLPTNPVDGASDHIALDVLDDVLEKVAKDQDRFSKLKDAPEPTPASAPAVAAGNAREGPSLSRNTSTDSCKSSNNTEVVDGIILKTPPLNFGVPIGQV